MIDVPFLATPIPKDHGVMLKVYFSRKSETSVNGNGAISTKFWKKVNEYLFDFQSSHSKFFQDHLTIRNEKQCSVDFFSQEVSIFVVKVLFHIILTSFYHELKVISATWSIYNICKNRGLKNSWTKDWAYLFKFDICLHNGNEFNREEERFWINLTGNWKYW